MNTADFCHRWEVFFGIVAACVPTLRPGYRWLSKTYRTSTLRSRMQSISHNLSATFRPNGTGNKIASSPKAQSATPAPEDQDDGLPMQRLKANHVKHLDIKWESGPHPSRGDIEESRMMHHTEGDISLSGHIKQTDSEATLGPIEPIEDRI